jgi:hypothetical protein
MNAPIAFIMFLGVLNVIAAVAYWPDPFTVVSGVLAGFCFGSAFTEILNDHQ